MNTSWLNTKEYPFQHHYFDLGNAKMHYVDEGTGEVILFVHGTPSWSFEFRHLIRDLSKKYRCIAIDHIGFGLSDKPEKYNYTTQQHAENLAHFIDSLALQSFHLVLHDFGGPIGLHYAVKHAEKIRSLIIANTWCRSSETEPSFIKMKKILGSPLLPFLYRRFNLSARYILPAAYGERSRLTKEIHKQFTAPFGKASERNGTVGFAKSLLQDQSWFESIWDQIDAIADKSVLLIWGMKDAFVTERYLQTFEAKFTNHRTIQYEDAGHFVLDEKSFAAVTEIEKFLAGKS